MRGIDISPRQAYKNDLKPKQEIQKLHTLDLPLRDLEEFITIYKGDKYLDTKGQVYALCECDTTGKRVKHKLVGTATVIGTRMTTVSVLGSRPRELWGHHSVSCRTPVGLWEALRAAYGSEVRYRTPLCVVTLRRVKTWA